MATSKPKAKTLPVGTPVGFKYRGAKSPHGTVAGVVHQGTTSATTMYSVRPAKDSRHPGEPALIHRRGDKLHRRSGS
ncbi:hypothetical protein [Candidimonas nitroreducens]|uniref:Hypervirulence associated protein TUDOR domain-containing protein n=1 Tax=Candidimonas nitroreducens TaxID=683354 RepID=A0A225M8I8_9BURK|nr:hypothetical protein [Candidimonas nitroreducens]OWT55269.1 hypothetical protein CEY11_21405 [Candidimonas nitroreducens]